MSQVIEPTERTKLRRLPKRGSFERDTIYQILDEAFICHVGFMVDGHPFVIPTGFARIKDNLLIHGSAASRMLRAMTSDIDVCVTVTLIDGLVLARSAFHHSMNYRSVVILGKASVVEGEKEKLMALEAFTNHIIPDRWAEVRPPNKRELQATLVLSLPLTEASAKVRTGGPIDDQADYALDVWAGLIPVRLIADAPVPDDRLKNGIPIPFHVSKLQETNRGRDCGDNPMALEMKTKCEKCEAGLAATAEAYICSYECTFCVSCAIEMKAVCPNCGGELVRRPRR